MQDHSSITEIVTRAKKIGYGAKDLAADAGVAESTVHRGIHGLGDSRMGTYRRLLAAVIAKEIELRDYLLALHPVETHKLEAAE